MLSVTPSPVPAPATISGLAPITWDGISTIIAALIAAAVVFIGYAIQQKINRDAARDTHYAEAIRAVNDYLEAPYLVRRRDGGATSRMSVTDRVSEIQSRLAFYQTLLELHAPRVVANAYKDVVATAKLEAGPQMSASWRRQPTRRDSQVPLGARYAHPETDRAIQRAVAVMKHPRRHPHA